MLYRDFTIYRDHMTSMDCIPTFPTKYRQENENMTTQTPMQDFIFSCYCKKESEGGSLSLR